MNPSVDLSQLAVDRTTGPRSPQRRLAVRYLLPAAVLGGFVGLVAWAARESWLPARPVKVVPVVALRSENQSAGTALFQAAGWIEPHPTPVLVTAMAEGVVEELLVVEGQSVEAGQPVARLIEADARLALQQAEADLALQESRRAAARAQLATAERRLEQPLELDAARAEAAALLARAEADLAALPHQLKAAQSAERLARDNLQRRRSARDALAGRLVREAESELEHRTAQLEELRVRQGRLEEEVRAWRQKHDTLEKQRELLIDESQQVADAQAALSAALAEVRRAAVQLDAARLRRERMTVRAPTSGRVLRLVAQPGTRVAGLAPDGFHDPSTIVTLYDPQLLQVRADVRLEDVPRVEAGQSVRIQTASAAEPIEGEVLWITSTANVQKNTLEVKVLLKNPPPTVRPEMLVEATFLAAARPSDSSQASQQRLFIPEALVVETSQGPGVWLAGADGRARRQPIELGPARRGPLVEVASGLTATDKLIAQGETGLSDGERIEIVGEEEMK